MSFTWPDLVALSEELEKGQSDSLKEARLRSAISRAYYAAHKSAVEFLARPPHSVKFTRTGTDHQKAIAELKRLGGGYRSAGRKLDQLRNQRTKADYVSSFPDALPNSCDTAIKRCKKILSAL